MIDSLTIPVTCVIPVYIGNSEEQICRAILSMMGQTCKIDEILVAIDGPLQEGVEIHVKDLHKAGKIHVVESTINIGLPNILNLAIAKARNNLVMRLDADDWSVATRVENQYRIFLERRLDICGTWTREIHSDGHRTKQMPTNHDDIINYARFRNPINHPTVMFNKKVWLDCGGYTDEKYFEDFSLWLRAIKRGFTLGNIPEPLVYMTMSDVDLTRRSGWRYASLETHFYMRRVLDGTLPFWLALINIAIKAPIRVLPRKLFAKLYKRLRR